MVGVGGAGEVQPVAAQRVAIRAHVRAAGPWHDSQAMPNSAAVVSTICVAIGCDPNGVSNCGLPCVAWQATQMPFQWPVSENGCCVGGCSTASAARNPALLAAPDTRRQLAEQPAAGRSRTSRSADGAIRWSSPPGARSAAGARAARASRDRRTRPRTRGRASTVASAGPGRRRWSRRRSRERRLGRRDLRHRAVIRRVPGAYWLGWQAWQASEETKPSSCCCTGRPAVEMFWGAGVARGDPGDAQGRRRREEEEEDRTAQPLLAGGAAP